MTTCESRSCENEADLAIRSHVPKGKSLVNTIYQDPDDAPKTAARYCVNCGMGLARELTRLSNPEGATS